MIKTLEDIRRLNRWQVFNKMNDDWMDLKVIIET